MIDPTIIILLIIWVILTIGLVMREMTIMALASLLMIAFGIYMTVNGVGGMNNWVTQALAVIHIGLGSYTIIRGYYEQYKDL